MMSREAFSYKTQLLIPPIPSVFLLGTISSAGKVLLKSIALGIVQLAIVPQLNISMAPLPHLSVVERQ